MSTGQAIKVAEVELRPFFTPKTLAMRLAMSERSVRELLHTGKIPSYRIGGSRRIDPDDVDRYLANRRDEGSP